MIYYLVIFFALSLFSIVDNISSFKKNNLVFFLFFSCLLIFFCGFRLAGVGSDDFNYVDKFLEVPDIGKWITGEYKYSFSKTWMEPGYIFLGALIRFFSNDYFFLFVTISFLSVGFASFNYYKYSPFPFLALLLFFVHTYLYRDMNQIRSAVAAATGLFLISLIHDRKHLKIFFTICFAGLFHTAALSYFLIYIFSFIKINRKMLLFGFLVALFLGVAGISSFVLNLLPNLGYITSKLVNYSNSRYANSVSLFDITNIKNMFLFFVFLYFWRPLNHRLKYFETMMLFYFFAVSWRVLFNDFGIFAARVATFFGIVEVILVSSLLYVFRQKIAATVLILIYAFLTLYLNLFFKAGRHPYIINF